MLMQWGPLQFEVYPLNTHEWEHVTAAEFARKEIAGAQPAREYVGEDDDSIFVRGRVYPLRLGGYNELEVMERMRREAQANKIIIGSGQVIGPGEGTRGWYIMEQLVRTHRFLAANGVGQEIAFEAVFTEVRQPSGAEFIEQILTMTR